MKCLVTLMFVALLAGCDAYLPPDQLALIPPRIGMLAAEAKLSPECAPVLLLEIEAWAEVYCTCQNCDPNILIQTAGVGL